MQKVPGSIPGAPTGDRLHTFFEDVSGLWLRKVGICLNRGSLAKVFSFGLLLRFGRVSYLNRRANNLYRFFGGIIHWACFSVFGHNVII